MSKKYFFLISRLADEFYEIMTKLKLDRIREMKNIHKTVLFKDSLRNTNSGRETVTNPKKMNLRLVRRKPRKDEKFDPLYSNHFIKEQPLKLLKSNCFVNDGLSILG